MLARLPIVPPHGCADLVRASAMSYGSASRRSAQSLVNGGTSGRPTLTETGRHSQDMSGSRGSDDDGRRGE